MGKRPFLKQLLKKMSAKLGAMIARKPYWSSAQGACSRPVDGRRCRHGWADQMGAATSALAAFKVAVAGAGAALTGFQAVCIHGQAHAATRFAPLKACRHENLVQAFAFGLFLDQPRARHHQCQP
jgi:hypothetical protein